jgi:hypothetical protein
MTSTYKIRGELFVALSQLGECRPEWRLGQTLANLAMTAGRMDPGGVWDLEDDEALAAAKVLISQYSAIQPMLAGHNAIPGTAYDVPLRRVAPV